MFDELFIKEMSSIDAYNYGRQMMEKELNKLGECEYNKGRADEQERILSIVSRCIAHNVYNVSEGIALLNEIKEELKEQKNEQM